MSPFTPPQQTTNPAGPTVRAAEVANATVTSAANHAPTVPAPSPENLLNEMLLASMAVRGIGGAAPQGADNHHNCDAAPAG